MPPIVTKKPTEFRSREAYPKGSCLRCANCGAVHTVEQFPDAPEHEQPDGISPYCQGCNGRLRSKAAAEADAPPVKTREQAAAEMAAQMAEVPKEAPPVVESAENVDADGQPNPPDADGEPADDLNNGMVTPGAQVRLDADKSLVLKAIPGRSPDGKVGVPEIEAYRRARAETE